MKNLIIFGLMSMVLSNCGGDDRPKKRSVPSAASLTNDPSQDPAQNCDPAVEKDCVPVYSKTPVPVYNSPVYRVGTNVDIPSSYTMLDTPDANLCVDAFIRKGIALPAETHIEPFHTKPVSQVAFAVDEAINVPLL